MKIIVFNKYFPRPDISSGERRFIGILELLAGKHKVDLCITAFSGEYLKPEYQQYADSLKIKGINVLPIEKNSVRKSLLRQKYDIGFFEFYWLAEKYLPYFWHYQPDAVTVVDSVDVHFAREESQANLGLISRKKAGNTKKREIRVYRNADMVIAVSEEDFDLLTKTLEKGKTLLIPNIVPSLVRAEIRREPVIIFIGSYAWPPNVDAVKWFTEKIWPIVHSNRNDARMQIIGSSITPEIEALKGIPGVEVLGYVTDTTLYLERAAISVAPLRFGGGMKGKVNEALAHGIPVIATSTGAQGFHANNGEEMIITDDPVEFAGAILRLIDDPQLQRKIGLAGQALNERYCSPEAVSANIDDLIRRSEKVVSAKPIKSKRKVSVWIILYLVHQAAEIIRFNKEKYFKK
jgi:O-antigen biosynthesis protein